MNLIGLFVIVPLSFAALLTGLVQSFGTHWGLLRYYWVVVKFLLTIAATVLLLLHQFVAVAGAARRVSAAAVGSLPDVGRLGPQLVGDAGLALLVLLATTTLSVYKPWGLTRYGQRSGEQQPAIQDQPGKRFKTVLAVIAMIVAAFVLLHLMGGGLRHGG